MSCYHFIESHTSLNIRAHFVLFVFLVFNFKVHKNGIKNDVQKQNKIMLEHQKEGRRVKWKSFR